jgi:hypothetical protein
LLDLGPAAVIAQNAFGIWVGQCVDADPVVGLARRAAEKLPRPLGIGGQESRQVPHPEPAGFTQLLTKQAIGDVEDLGRGRLSRAALERLMSRIHERQSDSQNRSQPGRDQTLARDEGRVAQLGEARSKGGHECVGIADEVRQALSKLVRPRQMRSHELLRSDSRSGRGRGSDDGHVIGLPPARSVL